MVFMSRICNWSRWSIEIPRLWHFSRASKIRLFAVTVQPKLTSSDACNSEYFTEVGCHVVLTHHLAGFVLAGHDAYGSNCPTQLSKVISKVN